MKLFSIKKILAFALVAISTSFAYDYSDNYAASQQAPGGLAANEVPMFVSLGWDDNGYSGLPASSYDGGMTWSTDFQKNLVNPAGTGNAATFDGAAVRTTYFMTSYYISTWGSENPAFVKKSWRTAYDDGHEIANHTENHGDGEPYSVATWDQELSECMTWLQKPFDPNESSPNNTKGIGVPQSKLTGFRSPFLHYNNNLFTSLKNQGLTYGASIEDGYWAGYNGGNGYWPHTLDNGSPVHDDLYARGVKSFEVTDHPGVWEMGVPVLIVPDQATAASYGLSYDLRVAIKAKWPSFDPNSPLIGGMDYNLWVAAKLTKEEVLVILKYNLDLRLNGNRAPMLLVLHTDEYSPKYTHAPNATAPERRQAIEEFMAYALSKQEVRVAPYDKILDWVKNPVALGSTGGNSSVAQSSVAASSVTLSSSEVVLSSVAASSVALSSSELASSSATAGVECDGVQAWQAKTYNWTGVKEYVVYNNSLYSHTNWVNASTPNTNNAWLLEGACGVAASSEAQSSVAASSIALSSSVAPSSIALSSSEAVSSSEAMSSIAASSVAPSSVALSSSEIILSSVAPSSVAPSSSIAASSSVSGSVCDGVADWSTITSWAQFGQGDIFTNGTQVATCNSHPAYCYGSNGSSFATSYWKDIQSCSVSPAPIQAKIGVNSDEITNVLSYELELSLVGNTLELGQVGNYQVTVLGVNGQVLLSESVSNAKSLELNITGQKLFFVNVKSATQTKTLKVTK